MWEEVLLARVQLPNNKCALGASRNYVVAWSKLASFSIGSIQVVTYHLGTTWQNALLCGASGASEVELVDELTP